MALMMIDATELEVGDVIVYDPFGEQIPVEVVRDAEDGRDLFGRPLIRYWCKGDGREGFMSYGPDGKAWVQR